MAESVVKKLPLLAEVERDIAQHRRELQLLQSLRDILKRKEAKERAGAQLAAEGQQS